MDMIAGIGFECITQFFPIERDFATLSDILQIMKKCLVDFI